MGCLKFRDKQGDFDVGLGLIELEGTVGSWKSYALYWAPF